MNVSSTGHPSTPYYTCPVDAYFLFPWSVRYKLQTEGPSPHLYPSCPSNDNQAKFEKVICPFPTKPDFLKKSLLSTDWEDSKGPWQTDLTWQAKPWCVLIHAA